MAKRPRMSEEQVPELQSTIIRQTLPLSVYHRRSTLSHRQPFTPYPSPPQFNPLPRFLPPIHLPPQRMHAPPPYATIRPLLQFKPPHVPPLLNPHHPTTLPNQPPLPPRSWLPNSPMITMSPPQSSTSLPTTPPPTLHNLFPQIPLPLRWTSVEKKPTLLSQETMSATLNQLNLSLLKPLPEPAQTYQIQTTFLPSQENQKIIHLQLESLSHNLAQTQNHKLIFNIQRGVVGIQFETRFL